MSSFSSILWFSLLVIIFSIPNLFMMLGVLVIAYGKNGPAELKDHVTMLILIAPTLIPIAVWGYIEAKNKEVPKWAYSLLSASPIAFFLVFYFWLSSTQWIDALKKNSDFYTFAAIAGLILILTFKLFTLKTKGD